MEHQALLKTLIAYHEAFAERNAARRLELLGRSMTPNAEIWGPKRVFAGYEAISEKIEGFHRNWPECRLALTTGFNTFLNTAHLGIAIIGSDGAVRASGRSVIEFADDGRIQRVLPLWEALPPLPTGWPEQFAPTKPRASQVRPNPALNTDAPSARRLA
jgi:hypothetical protein